jgi:glycosyltransferase involved in cell wall biosynthesis
VGRLEEQKNPFRFIDIIAAVSKSTAIEARWVGDGSLYESAKSYAERLSAPIEFVGYRPNVIAELDRADGILITSSWEGLPLVALEAMARKRPVVGSRVGGLPALLDEGRGLLLTENADLNADAELCIDGFTASPATSARTESAFMYVRERLSPERVFDPILEVYCSVGKDR